jgi:hypothetical protein
MAKKKTKVKTKKTELFLIPLMVFVVVFLASVLVILLFRGTVQPPIINLENDSPQQFDFVEAVEGTPSLPNEFPDDFPVYPQATLKDSWSSDGSSVLAMSVVWETDASSQEIANFYRSELSAMGWKEVSSFTTADSDTLTFNKNNTDGYIAVAKSSGFNTISVTLGIKK